MKFKDEDDKALLLEACIVEIMKYTLDGNDDTKEAFQKLKETIKNSDNLSFEYLKSQNSSNDFAIRRFFNYFETYKKSVINREYYNQAVEIAKSQSLPEEFNEKIKNQFFSEKRIEGLEARLDKHRQSKKFIAVGTSILALAAAGGLALAVAGNHRTSDEPTPTPIESTATPNPDEKTFTYWTDSTPTPKPTTEIADLDPNDKDFYDKVVQDFKKRYAEQYNMFHEKQLSTDDFVVKAQEAPDYIFKIKLGNATIYMSKGDENYNSSTEQYLKENHIEAEDIHDCKAVSIYAAKNGKRIKDANGSYIKLDSIVKFTPATKDFKTKTAFLFDGNKVKEVLNNPSLSLQSSTLLDMSNSAFALADNSHEKVKEDYLEAIEKEDSRVIDCGLENQIDEKLPKKELEDKER